MQLMFSLHSGLTTVDTFSAGLLLAEASCLAVEERVIPQRLAEEIMIPQNLVSFIMRSNVSAEIYELAILLDI